MTMHFPARNTQLSRRFRMHTLDFALNSASPARAHALRENEGVAIIEDDSPQLLLIASLLPLRRHSGVSKRAHN